MTPRHSRATVAAYGGGSKAGSGLWRVGLPLPSPRPALPPPPHLSPAFLAQQNVCFTLSRPMSPRSQLSPDIPPALAVSVPLPL